MAVCYLGALLAYLRGASWRVSALLFVLAVAIRETAVTLPAALLLCELTRGERPSLKALARRQGVHWLLLAAGALFVLLNERYFAHLAFGFTRRGMAENLMAQIGGVSYLVSRLLALSGYNIDPALSPHLDWDPVLGMQAGLLAALALLGLASLRSRPWIAFGIGWFFLQLAPTNSIVPRLDVANDRQLYLASWGLFLALSVQLAHLRWRMSLNVGVAGVLLCLCAATSVARQLDYASEIALWQASVSASPWNARAHNNLGYAYQLAGRRDDARREYQTALLFDPANPKARLNLRFLR
jgi:tetratricopeptide (TPR) repeat protein